MADKAIVAQYSPGDVVHFLYDPVSPYVVGHWTVLRVLVDGSLLLRRGDERRIDLPEEV